MTKRRRDGDRERTAITALILAVIAAAVVAIHAGSAETPAELTGSRGAASPSGPRRSAAPDQPPTREVAEPDAGPDLVAAGEVLAFDSELPLSGAAVVHEDGDGATFRTETADDGSFGLPRDLLEAGTLMITAPGRLPVRCRLPAPPRSNGARRTVFASAPVKVDFGSHGARDGPTVFLKRPLLVSGVVLGEGDAPAAGVPVRLDYESWNDVDGRTCTSRTRRLIDAEPREVVTDVEGRFAIDVVAHHAVVVLAASAEDGRRRGELSLTMADRPRYGLVIRLVSGASLDGVLLRPGGEPAAGVEVAYWCLEDWEPEGPRDPRRAVHETRTDARGRFAFRVLPAGRARLVLPGCEDWYLDEESSEVVLAEEEAREASLVVRPTLTIGGRVVLQDGRPVAGASVNAVRLRGRRGASARSAEDGTFLLRGLVPGAYELEAACFRFDGKPQRMRAVLEDVLAGTANAEITMD